MSDEKYNTRKNKVYDFMCDSVYVPMKIKELAIVLGVKKEDRPALEQMLEELVAEGKVQISRRGKYSKAEERKLTGVFQAHPRGFGFVTVEGEPEDIFIAESQTGGAMHLDRVEIAVSPASTGRRKEGAVLRVLERGIRQVVGTFEESRNFGFVVPDNAKLAKDIFVPKEHSMGAVSGHKVVVEITGYGEPGRDRRHAQSSPEGGLWRSWDISTIRGWIFSRLSGHTSFRWSFPRSCIIRWSAWQSRCRLRTCRGAWT